MMQTAQQGRELVLRLDNQRPIKAAQFARLLRDLASDYKRLYGDELVIVGVPEGSLVAKLRSFSKFAQEANHILDFGTKLAAIFGATALGAAALGLVPDRSPSPLKAAQSLATIAVQSGSTMELKYSESGKQEILIKVTPAQAERVKALTDDAIRARKALTPPRPTYVQEHALSGLRSADPGDTLMSQLTYFSQREGGLDKLAPDARSLIATLVLELNAAAPYRVSQVIMDLEAEGNFAAAKLVRDILNGTDGGGSTFARLGRG